MAEQRKTKIGQRRTEPKRYTLKRKPINKVSKKRQKESPIYYKLVRELREKSGNVSELSGEKPDWQTKFKTEPHHICGRNNGGYANPFNIILVTRTEHDNEEDHKSFERKEFLLRFIKPIRLLQGYKVEDYE